MNLQSEKDAGNKQVMAGTFYNLIRYALRKIKRDIDSLGVNSSNFNVAAMDESLAASVNLAISPGNKPLTIAKLIKKARQSPLTFHFHWRPANNPSVLLAAFELSYEDGDLKVRLLWLGLPEHIPISPRVGVIDGRRPLGEAVTELLLFKSDRLSPYPPPTSATSL